MIALAAALQDAAPIVARVAGGVSLAAEFERYADEATESPRAALIDLTHGTLRRYGRVQAIVRLLSRREGADPVLQALLWCSIYAKFEVTTFQTVNEATLLVENHDVGLHNFGIDAQYIRLVRSPLACLPMPYR